MYGGYLAIVFINILSLFINDEYILMNNIGIDIMF